MPTRSIPWPRILAEGFAIVVSILLAFGIQAWWENHQLHEEERQVLQGLAQEIEEAKVVIEASRVQTVEARERLQFFLSATPSELTSIPTAAALDQVYLPLTRQWAGSVPRGALDAATGSGQLGLISDPQLRAALARLGGHHASVDGIRDLISDLDARASVILGESEGVSVDTAGARVISAEALRAFRADPRIRGAANAKFGFTGGYLIILSSLEDAMDETLALITGQR